MLLTTLLRLKASSTADTDRLESSHTIDEESLIVLRLKPPVPARSRLGWYEGAANRCIPYTQFNA